MFPVYALDFNRSTLLCTQYGAEAQCLPNDFFFPKWNEQPPIYLQDPAYVEQR